MIKWQLRTTASYILIHQHGRNSIILLKKFRDMVVNNWWHCPFHEQLHLHAKSDKIWGKGLCHELFATRFPNFQIWRFGKIEQLVVYHQHQTLFCSIWVRISLSWFCSKIPGQQAPECQDQEEDNWHSSGEPRQPWGGIHTAASLDTGHRAPW